MIPVYPIGPGSQENNLWISEIYNLTYPRNYYRLGRRLGAVVVYIKNLKESGRAHPGRAHPENKKKTIWGGPTPPPTL